jgi:adenosine deaminase
LLRAGVRVTVNSDDPAYFGGYVVDNYLALAEEASLTPAEVVTLAENSFVISWIDEERRAAHLEEIARYVDGFAD